MLLPLVSLAALEVADEDDPELLRRARDGDRDAFGELFSKYSKRVFRVARRMCRNDEDAWDVTQEAFIRAMQAMPGFDTRFRFFTWIYRITTNLAINLSQKRQRHAEVMFDEEYGAEGLQALPDDLSERAAASELATAIEGAVQRLSPPLRAVFVLRVDQQLSYSEIASTLGIAMGTVMSRLNRARNEVRKAVSYLLEEKP
jgi:RNA polymerase sigma-70 factor, ECF subfamily